MAERRALTLALTAAGFASAAVADTAGDTDRGEVVFAQCRACHDVGAEAGNRVGPHLNDLFGRTAGELAGFRYSAPMRDAGENGLTWSEETLSDFLESPREMVPGTRMSFRGLSDEGDRADVIEYLRSFSGDELPKSGTTSAEIDLPPELLEIEGDPAYGEYLSGECTTCHQASGADEGIPSITGWPEADFVAAMHAYKEKVRENPVMQMITGRLSDEEIAALAAYFAERGR